LTVSIEPVKLNKSINVLISDDTRDLTLTDWVGFRVHAYGPPCTNQIHDKSPARRAPM
jgi:hypothetical protein